MLRHKENCGLLYTIILENHLKYTCLNINNVNMVLGLFTVLYQLLCNIGKMRW
jgi:hypothetical protein